MDTRRRITCAILAFAVAGCGTPEEFAKLNGVRPEDARVIGSIVRKQTSAKITSYERDRDGVTINVWVQTSEGGPDLYQAKRVAGSWDVVHNMVLY